MKSNAFRTVKLVKTIELKIDKETAIERLQSLENSCYTRDGNDELIVFYCTDKGQLAVTGRVNSRAFSSMRVNDVRGQIENEGGKTVVKIYSVHDRSVTIFKWIYSIVYALGLVISIVNVFLTRRSLTVDEIISAIFGAGIAVVFFSINYSENKNTNSDFEIMVREIERRLEAAERWDDLKPLDFD